MRSVDAILDNLLEFITYRRETYRRENLSEGRLYLRLDIVDETIAMMKTLLKDV